MALIDLVPPVVEPVDLTYAKIFLRVDGTHEDGLITDLISIARLQVENIIGRTLIRRTYVYKGACPNGHCLVLPRPPLLAVLRLSLIAENDQAVDIPTNDYSVSTRRDPGEIHLNENVRWSDYLAEFSRIEIEFSAGYGDDPADVPLPIKQAILLLLAQHYEHRDGAESLSVPMMVDALLMPYRWVRL